MTSRRRGDPGGHRIRSALALLLLPAGLLACVSGPWDVAELGRRYPALAEVSAHRLSDVNPYLLPANGQVAFFLCRWPSDRPIPVSLPPDATPEELEVLQAVLRAWEGAGLGVRFATGDSEGVGIEVRFIDPAQGATDVVYAGNTIADCAVRSATVAAGESSPELRARLVFASIHLWRSRFDDLGRPVANSRAEFAGSALHEFGHALGFQGHVQVGKSIMVKEKDVLRRAGGNLLKGRAFEDATLRALYSVPSGSVIKRATVEKHQTQVVDDLRRIGLERGFVGPKVRVGDLDGFIAWRSAEGERYLLRIADVKKVMRAPETLWVEGSFEISEMLEAN